MDERNDWPERIYRDAEIEPGVYVMQEVESPERQQDG